jgi:hypothetical protein
LINTLQYFLFFGGLKSWKKTNSPGMSGIGMFLQMLVHARKVHKIAYVSKLLLH